MFHKLSRRNNTHPFSHIILWTILAFIILAILCASFLNVDVVTKAEGQVVPSKHVQLVENLEGGIVRKINVQVGAIVQKNQVLMQLDSIRFQSEYQEGRGKEIALKLKVARLESLVQHQPFVPPQELMSAAPELAQSEEALYLAKKQELDTLQIRLDLSNKEITMSAPLVKEGIMSKVELIHLERDSQDIQGRMSNFSAQLLSELNEGKDKLAQIKQTNTANQDRLVRTTVTSPVYGIVKQIYVNTEGAVIKPGAELVEIVPLDDTLLVEARVRPADVGFIHVGQKATVKITAYDYTIYGGLVGRIEHISADTVKDEHENNFYLIKVRTDNNSIVFKDKKYMIMPGMVSTVDILTGKRTIMHYILKPLMRVKDAALIER